MVREKNKRNHKILEDYMYKYVHFCQCHMQERKTGEKIILLIIYNNGVAAFKRILEPLIQEHPESMRNLQACASPESKKGINYTL